MARPTRRGAAQNALRAALAEAQEARMRRWRTPGKPRFVSPYRDTTSDVDIHVADALAIGLEAPVLHQTILTTAGEIRYEPTI